MLYPEFITRAFALGLLLFLAGFLFHTWLERRQLDKVTRRQAVKTTSATIDVAPLRSRLEALKRGFSAAAHSRSSVASPRAELLASAREHLKTLGFFRNHAPEEEAERNAQ